MNKVLSLLVVTILTLLVGCSPIPIAFECNEIRFKGIPEISEIKYFAETGFLSQSCPVKTPKLVIFEPSPTKKFEIRIDGEWLRIRSISEKPFIGEISSRNTISKTDKNGITHVRVKSSNRTLSEGYVNLKFENLIEINFEFEDSVCKCITYDAV
jgi:hypothetical protein